MTDDSLVDDLLPEWASFRDVAATRNPEHGTACAAWTTRDVIAHQAGTAVELGRVLVAHLDRRPVPPTRSFEEREPPFRDLTDDGRLAALEGVLRDLARVLERGLDEPHAWVPWTRRHMKVSWFGEHMRSELVLHRWDLIGDDETSTRHLAEPWMTSHTVDAVGRPLLQNGAGLLGEDPFRARLHVVDRPDVEVVGGAEPSIRLVDEGDDGSPDLVTDAAARVLLLWGRQPADPARLRSEAGPVRLGRLRTMLSGY